MRRRGPGVLDLDLLSERDCDVLRSVQEHRLMTTKQIERLWFWDHATPLSAARICQRTLRRLVEHELLVRLNRRVGGYRSGSSGYCYRLSTRGLRAVRMGGRTRTGSGEFSLAHWKHLIACGEISVGLQVLARTNWISDLRVIHEPHTWRRFLGPSITTECLKPDLLVEFTTQGGWETRWFIEVDRSTESLPRVLRKCAQYERYYRSGEESRISELFPKVLWSTPDEKRRDAIAAAVQHSNLSVQELFAFATAEHTTTFLAGINEIPEPSL